MSRREVRRRLRRLGDPSNWQVAATTTTSADRATSLLTALRQPGVLVTAVVGVLIVVGSVSLISRQSAAPRPATSGIDRSTPTNSTNAVTTPVPWVDDSPTPSPTPAPVSAPDCTPSDFAVTAHLEGTVMNYTQAPVVLVQHTAHACALTTGFVLDTTKNGVRVTAARLAIASVGAKYSLTRSTSGGYVVPPRTRLQLRITGVPANIETGVGAYDRPAWIRINGASVRLPGGDLPADVVDRGVTLTADSPVDPQDAGTGLYSALLAHIDVSSEPVRSSVWRYAVTLRNTRSTTFAFGSSCPGYDEAIDVFPTGSRVAGDEQHVLNCTGLTIPGGGSVTFAMQLAVPDAAGTTRTFWGLDDGPSDATQTVTRG